MNAVYTGAKITELRKAKGWTQKDIAEKLHVTVSAVSKWERGLNYPDLALMEPLAEILSITVSELLGLQEQSADSVIHNITVISETEKNVSKQIFRKRLWFVALSVISFILVSWLILKIGGKDDFLYLLFESDGRLWCDVLAILLGLASWVLAFIGVFSQRRDDKWKTYTIISLTCCAVSLYLPTLITDLVVRFEWLGTIEDTIWGYNFASLVLILGTAILNICSWLSHRGWFGVKIKDNSSD